VIVICVPHKCGGGPVECGEPAADDLGTADDPSPHDLGFVPGVPAGPLTGLSLLSQGSPALVALRSRPWA
jgi:hypothetical protein